MADDHYKALVDSTKEELMRLLAAQDDKALRVIARLKRYARENNDTALLGYVYYRYAYFYYFTAPEKKNFRKNLQIAIRHLLRAGDMEYLGSAYNLVAYDALDSGRFDIAYAYFMMAVKTSEQVEGIALPGLVEANAGHLLVELGNRSEGRKHLRSAIKRIRPFTDLHVYHYNMIVTYADEALASFLLGDRRGVAQTLRKIESHYGKCDKNEAALSLLYVLLPKMYLALLSGDGEALTAILSSNRALWREVKSGETPLMIFELESLINSMIENGFLKQAGKLLSLTEIMADTESYETSIRYQNLLILYHEKCGNKRKLRESLLTQHGIIKKQRSDSIRDYRYALEFVEMIESISRERQLASEENRLLRIKAGTDALTLLPNRGAMNERLSELFEEAQANAIPFAIGIMDVDDFKKYNDTLGHQAGDACLKKIGAILLSYMDDTDIYCARYGGDEFIVSFIGHSDDSISRISSELCEKVSETISVSLGICSGTPKASNKLWDFLSAADRELYRIKTNQRMCQRGGVCHRGRFSLTHF